MNQANQGTSSNASPAIPAKRKRGRPRKDRNLNHMESAPVPPGFEAVNGNQPRQVVLIDDANDGIVGQPVTGVVEAVFDAGYMLAVKIGNSNTSLRGVVFKPGHYSPVTAENDVAPHLQMIRRNEIRLPTENQTRVRRRKPRSRERNEQLVNYSGNGSPSENELHRLAPITANLVKGRYSSIVAHPSVPPVGARGTVVPVVLQPVNISNGLPPANQVTSAATQAAHMMALKGKHVQTVAPLAVYPPPNASTPSQALTSQPQTSPHVTPIGKKIENGPFNQDTSVLQQWEEAKSMKLTQPSETHIGNSKAGYKPSAEDSGVALEQEIEDMNDEPLFIEPLQTVHSYPYNQYASV